MVFSLTDVDEVSKILKWMKNKSCGHDGLSNKILNPCSPVIDENLAFAINKGFTARTFHDCLKTAIVRALFQKREKMSQQN